MMCVGYLFFKYRGLKLVVNEWSTPKHVDRRSFVQYKLIRPTLKRRNGVVLITPIVPLSACGINSQYTHCFCQISNYWGLNFLQCDTNFMNTCSFIIRFKKMNVCCKVFVERIICFGELDEASSSSFQPVPFTLWGNSYHLETKEKLALRVSGILTLWVTETLDLILALIP